MAKVGRPSKYKPEYCDQLIEHMKEGLSYDSFAGLIRVNDDTLREWEKKHSEFAAAKKEARRLQALFWEKLGRAAAAGKVEGFNATAFVWMTKNMLGWREKTDLEVSGKAGSPVEIKTSAEVRNLTDAELKKQLREILKDS